MKIETYKRRAKNNVSKQTLESRLSALRSVEKYVSGAHPTKEEMEEWADSMLKKYEKDEVSSGTINQYFKSIKYYYETMGLDFEEIEHIKKWLPDSNTDPGDFLTRKELEKLRSSINSVRTRAIVELMYYYGRRPGEIRLLNVSDIDWPEDVGKEDAEVRFCILKKTDTKLPKLKLYNNGEVSEEYKYYKATFDFREEPFGYVRTYLNYRDGYKQKAVLDGEEITLEPLFTTASGRISSDTICRNISAAAENAGIDKDITPKSLRHSRTTHLYWDGKTKSEIASKQLVHSPNSNEVSTYIHERDQDEKRDPLELEGDG